MIHSQKCEYLLLHETTVDESLAAEHRRILRENVIDVGGSKLFTITYDQVLQDFGVRNWNGRIYNETIVMRGLDGNPLVQHDIKQGTWTAEYGHPLIEKGMNELARQMTIFPPNACNTINNYRKEGNLLLGQCTTLAGGYGDILRDRILTGYPAMASSRAIGGVDKNGNVLPGYTIITFDTVIRPSHKTAYQVKNSEHINEFPIRTGQVNTMTESAIKYDFTKDPSFGNFLLSESCSKNKIEMLCDTFKLEYDSMTITENSVEFSSLNGNELTTVVIPMNRLINAEYYNLFK